MLRVRPARPKEFIEVQHPHPHGHRGQQILAGHPELRALCTPAPSTAGWIMGVVALQTVVAIALARSSWWSIFIIAYGLGAVANLGAWVLIHEGGHGLISRSHAINRVMMILANLPIVIPAAASFRRFHLYHHSRQGDPDWDADLPSRREVRLVGRCAWRKALWLALYMPIQVARSIRLKHIRTADRWMALNAAATLSYATALTLFCGPGAVVYLLASSWSAMGLHPLGARWIQEHYSLHGDQETYSYYGPMNRLLFNAGYHNEHHDLPGIPWMHLPTVRATASEFYDPLHAHYSWGALLWQFLSNREIGLGCRVVRSSTLISA